MSEGLFERRGFEDAALPAIVVDVVDGWRVVGRRALLRVGDLVFDGRRLLS